MVTRGGGNQLHGSAWEFLRNNALDARDPFQDAFRSSPAPFRQNQFGAVISGTVLIPKVYNGRNRTFFLFAYEGWRYRQASQTLYRVPTDRELAGDFSNSIVQRKIYDPLTTRPDPNNPGIFIRDAFPGNVIQPSRIDATTLNFIEAYYARPNLTGDPVYNAIVASSGRNDSDQYNTRIDEQLGSKDTLFFRYSRLNVTGLSPISVSGDSGASVPAHAIGAGWHHIFNSSLILENHFGFADRPFSRFQTDSAGIDPMLKLGFSSPGGSTISLASPWGGGGLQNGNTINSPNMNLSHGLTWIRGGHNFKFGIQYIKQGNDSNSPPYGGYNFTDDTTGNPQSVGTTGASLASALLGLPSQTSLSNTLSSSNRVSIWSFYGQDEWRVRNNLTLTYGLRFDYRRPFNPSANTVISGPAADGMYWIGLDQLPPPCSQTGKAPCIPGDGTLQSIPNGDKIMLSPYGKAWGPAPDWSDWGPRLGLAWRLTGKTVVRAGYGIVYDPLTGIEQDWKGMAGSWPASASIFALKSVNQLGQPPTSIEQTFGQVGYALPDPTPWSQTNWFIDPTRKDSRSQQWNVEIQRQMSANLALSAAYVGSYSDHLDQTSLWNTAQTAGPGTPDQVNARRPFPWYQATLFYGTDHNNANYNALQLKLDRRFGNGFQYLISYTWSKAIDTGSSGWFSAENGPGGFSALQNPYDPNGSRSVASYDIPHFLSMSGVWELPFGIGKKYFSQGGAASWILGNWQMNGVVQLRSGQPFNVNISGDVANIGNTVSWDNYARPNLVGDPYLANPTSQEWFNPAAFAVPSFSYGNFGRNVLRTASVYDADLSLFKDFPIHEGWNLSFRSEFFNIFNIQNYGAPNSLIGDPGVGRITSTVVRPRQIQFGLRLSF